MLTPRHLAQKLDERFRVLTGGSRTALPRQQTMRALIGWSYDLLSPKEQTLFRRLAIFAGGWTLEIAAAVCADGEASEDAIEQWEILDLLSALVDKSLVQADNGQRNALPALGINATVCTRMPCHGRRGRSRCASSRGCIPRAWRRPDGIFETTREDNGWPGGARAGELPRSAAWAFEAQGDVPARSTADCRASTRMDAFRCGRRTAAHPVCTRVVLYANTRVSGGCARPS